MLPIVPRYRHESPWRNPSSADPHMPASPPAGDEYVRFFFPGAEMYHQETLEAVLWQPVTAPAAPAAAAGNEPASRDGGPVVGTPRKRPFRTDRHSKIRTAQGVRDRRMRLSVGVAREFFALQDMLGFDKASKTVDWLLTQSRPAIERLSDAAEGSSSQLLRPVSEKGDAASSSSNTDCFGDATARLQAGSESRMKGIGGDGSVLVAAERGEVDWFMSETRQR